MTRQFMPQQNRICKAVLGLQNIHWIFCRCEGDGQTGRIPGSPVRTIVLTAGAVPAGPPLAANVFRTAPAAILRLGALDECFRLLS